MLSKSTISLNCLLKPVEILVPDNVTYELSKFLILQTGEISMKSGASSRIPIYFKFNSAL